jgi:probable HAF family extracellular repeat protein
MAGIVRMRLLAFAVLLLGVATPRVTADYIVTDLGLSNAAAINNAGQVVGRYATPSGAVHAALWQNGVMTDLNDLLPPGSGWTLTEATAINDQGQIVGYGSHGTFLLTPGVPAVPEPGTLGLFGLGTLGLLSYGWRRRALCPAPREATGG